MNKRSPAKNAPARIEALIALVVASTLIRWLPFRMVVKIANISQRPVGTARAAHVDVERARQSVEGWARRVFWHTVCFQKALALHLLLRRHGVASVLHYGIRRPDALGVSAHVWVSIGRRIIIGEAESDGFITLLTCPPQDARADAGT